MTAIRQDCEFKEFRSLVDFWFAELAKLQYWNVLIKPHPASDPDDVEYMKTFPFPVVEIDTSVLIPICDLYNTSVSSTIRWALACGKPTLNFDVFRYHYRDFDAEAAVATVSTSGSSQ